MRRKHEDPQQLILNFIESYQANHQRPPTVREIQDKMGYKSPRAVSYFLEKLEKASLIIRKSRSRGIFLKTGRTQPRATLLPFFENLPVDMTDPVIPESSEHIAVDLSLFGVNMAEHCFAVKVHGRSMEGASLLDGDIAILELREPKENEIVCAMIEGDTYLRRLLPEEGIFYLKAEHPDYRDLIPTDSVPIHGVMVGLIRRFGL